LILADAKALARDKKNKTSSDKRNELGQSNETRTASKMDAAMGGVIESDSDKMVPTEMKLISTKIKKKMRWLKPGLSGKISKGLWLAQGPST